MSKKEISRRSFLRGAALGAVGMAAMGVAPVVAEEKTGIVWDQEYDIVIAGAGVGLAAACEVILQDPNASVVILEKSNNTGGLYKTAGGHAILGATRIQKEAGIEDDIESWYKDEIHAQSYRGVPELIRTYVERGPELIEWMEQFGFKWDPAVNDSSAGCMSVNRSHWAGFSDETAEGNRPSTKKGFGLSWTIAWEKFLAKHNVPILMQHKMVEVYREPDGPVTGVKVETPEGIKNIKAKKAVILCTGTWTDNYRMFQAWDRRTVGPDAYGDGGTPCDGTLLVDSAGDGHIAASKIGASFSDMSFGSYYYIFYGSRSYWGWEPYDNTEASYQGGKGIARTAGFFNHVMLVKNDGKRYVNESTGMQTGYGGVNENPEWEYTAAYLNLENLQQPRNVWAVADSAIAADLRWNIDLLNNPDPKKGSMFDPDCIAIADTIEELAEKMGVDAEGLKASIERYNGFVDAGKDEDFGKPDLAFKIATPPFYGLKASLIRHTQRNGVRVNTKAQVIAEAAQITGYDCTASGKFCELADETVIPHLYAAGELSNIMGWRRCHGSLGNYATFARIAAENAVKETPLD